MKSKTMLTIFILLFAVAFMSGCTQKTVETTTTPEVKTLEPIKIGVLTPLTGPAATYGSNVKEGIDLAVEKVNNEGGINGRKIVLEYQDSMCDPKTAISILEKFKLSNTKIIIGTVCSSVTLAIGGLIDENNDILISAGSSNPAISKFKNVFRTWPSDSFQAVKLGDFVASNYKDKKIAIVYIQNDYGYGLMNAFKSQLEKDGITVSNIETIPEKIADVRVQVTKLKSLKPDVVFIAAYSEETGNFLKTAKQLEFTPQFLSGEAISDSVTINISNDASDGVIGVRVKEENGTVRTQFIADFTKKYNKAPGIVSDTAYDNVLLLKNALTGIADANDINAIVSKVYTVNFEGASGTIKLDEQGDPIGKQYEIIQYSYKNNSYTVK